MDRIGAWLRIAKDRTVVSRALGTAAVVGFVLASINDGPALVRGQIDGPMVVRIAVGFLVPYVVATITAVAAVRTRQRGAEQDLLLLEREIEAIVKFPDQNPNPVMRISRAGRVLYANRSSAPVATALGATVGETLPEGALARMVEAASAVPARTVEVTHGSQTFAVLAVDVPELDVLNLYGTDITALKAIDRFPGGNPNPVLRMSPDGVLLYANQASEPIVASLDLGIGDPLPDELRASLTALMGPHARPIEIPADGHTYALKPVLIEEFGFINIYGTDVTAAKAINKFPDQNPNPVLRVQRDGRLEYANPASSLVLEGLGVQPGQDLAPDLMREIMVLAEQGGPADRLVVKARERVYDVYCVSVYEFGFINLYGTDVTAAREVERANRENERLLLNILPPSIAQRLKEAPDEVIADRFDEMTVLFADVVGFTPLSATLTPKEVVELLNRIFLRCDRLVDRYGLEKIKTIGDAYMVVGSLESGRHDDPERVAAMALDMMSAMTELGVQEGHAIAVRAGMHVGPAAAGVVGIKKFIYDVWGDTVNTASRMESQGVPGRIQVTEGTYIRLRDSYTFEPRGVVDVKGKGAIPTYLLVARRDTP